MKGINLKESNLKRFQIAKFFNRVNIFNITNIFNVLTMAFIGLLTLGIEPAAAFQSSEKVPTLGDIAGKLIIGTEFVTRLVLVACVTIGIILVISAFAYFRAHRRNPKFAPLDRPFFLLLFGLLLIAIPFLGEIFGTTTGSVLEIKKQETKARIAAPVDIDAPLELGNEYEH